MIELFDIDLRQSDYLAIAFTGVSHALGGIPFEFSKTLGEVAIVPLFLSETPASVGTSMILLKLNA